MSKQDRTAPRTAADLESKYNFGKTFAEMMGLAEDAGKAADEARTAADAAQNVVNGLDQDKIFNLLTNNGANQGIFRDENGEIYINASYLASGVIRSADGSLEIDLLQNILRIAAMADSVLSREIRFFWGGIHGYGKDAEGNMEVTMTISPGSLTSLETIISAHNGADLSLGTNGVYAEDGTAIVEPGYVNIGVGTRDKVRIMGRTLGWKDNGDGTFSLIGE